MSTYAIHQNIKSLTAEEEAELAKKINQGDRKSFEELVVRNINLVIYIVKRSELSSIYNLSEEDLVSEGNIGLIKAAESFNPEKGRFATYAQWKIKRQIYEFIEKNYMPFSIPKDMFLRLKKIRKYFFSQDVTPTISEIKEKFGLSNGTNIEHLISPSFISRDSIYKHHSTNFLFEDGLENQNFDTIKEEEPKKYFEQDSVSLLRKLLEEVLDKREHEIIFSRFGLNGHQQTTLRNVGKKFNITQERVRQIQSKAIEKLREVFDKY
jgi:RNA polymerase primary sigma factor